MKNQNEHAPVNAVSAKGRALQFIRSSISSGNWKPGEYLPLLTDMAHQCSVSKNSMWAAMVIAKKEGLVTGGRGSRIRAGSNFIKPSVSTPQVPATERHSVWKSAYARLRQQIIDGFYGEHGELPQAKELQTEFGICALTVRKIVRMLSAEGLIARHRRSHKIKSSSVPRRQNTIVLISEGFGLVRTGIHNERLRKIVEVLEMVCTRAGLRLVFAELDLTGPAVKLIDNPELDIKEYSLGYFFNMPEFPDKAWPRIFEVFRRITQSKKPVAVFDTVGTFSLPPDLASHKNIRIFRIAAFRAGAQVARFLLELGHRRIAYLSLMHQFEWSQKRLAGLQKEFAAAGCHDGVIPLVVDRTEGYNNRFKQFGKLTSKEIEQIMSIQSSPDQKGFQQDDMLIRSPARPEAIPSPATSTDLTVLKALADQRIDTDLYAAMRQAALLMSAHKRDQDFLETLMKAALADRQITAWVMANDGMAHPAQRFLEKHNVQVPQDLSVIGFDNIPFSFEMKLTSYDFNLQVILHRMLWFVLHPDMRRAKSDMEPEEIEGVLIERGTTGKAPKKK